MWKYLANCWGLQLGVWTTSSEGGTHIQTLIKGEALIAKNGFVVFFHPYKYSWPNLMALSTADFLLTASRAKK